MHQHRRRKKKPNYGVKTVEISRGKNGFGFTISGQAPCILSCIINGSPAEKAGLSAGDFLVAVNNQSVSKAPHDDVVRLIGNSTGVLKLQIAENYYSDSSEEEFISIAKLRPKYPNKVRNKQQNSVSRAEKVVHDLQTGALFVDHLHGCNEDVRKHRESRIQTIGSAGPSKSNNLLTDLLIKQKIKGSNCNQYFENTLLQQNGIPSVASKNKELCLKRTNKSQNYPEFLNLSDSSCKIFNSIFTEQDLNNILYPEIFVPQNSEEIKKSEMHAVLKAVVGYLGTIEMPKEQQLPNSRLRTIRNCIKRLRVEKKVHTLVLMVVFPQSIILINPQGVALAEFSADKVTFSGVYCDDKKVFGLVTDHGISNEDFCEPNSDNPASVSSSCHVFMVDPKISPHHQHTKRAKAFHIICTLDPVTKKCREFPESADSILQAVVSLYRNKLILNDEIVQELDFHVNISPQPSNTSSNSSNSDSGIGFRDEGNASDQVFFIDIDNYQYSTNSLDRQAFSTPGLGRIDAPIRYFSSSHERLHSTSKAANSSQTNEPKMLGTKCFIFDRLTVRAMPDPVGFQKNGVSQPDYWEQPIFHDINNYKLMQMKSAASNYSNEFQNIQQSETMCNENNDTSNKNGYVKLKENKLSPKVYEINVPLKNKEVQLSNSSEDLWDFRTCSAEQSQQQVRYLKLIKSQDTADINFNSHDDHLYQQEIDSEYDIRTGTISDGELDNRRASISNHTHTFDQLSDSSHHSSSISERPIDVGRVGSWTAGFNVLLDDPAGLHTFSEFLKKEFSQENITFWIACERYRQLQDQSMLSEKAKEIFSKHLCIGASEPVNVDSHARQIAQEGLDSPTTDLFLPAQKQIFNLMKFDCYQRFLKSSMFKECMLREVQGEPLLYPGHMQEMSKPINKRKKVSTMLKKRKSLIPWHKPMLKATGSNMKIVQR